MQLQNFRAGGSDAKQRNLLLLIGILIMSVNLRTPIVSVGPIVNQIRLSTGLSNSMLGLLTSLPMIAFGVISAIASGVARKFGLGITIGVSLLCLVFGNSLRFFDGIFYLYAGTIILGVSIAFVNVLIPSLTKRYFSSHAGAVTGAYTAVMAIGTSVAAGVSVPLSHRIGWRGALGIWGLFALVALIVWIPQMYRIRKTNGESGHPSERFYAFLRNPLAWKLAFFMGLQSWSSYIIMAWLPDILQSDGYNPQMAGWLLAFSQGCGILGSLFAPLLIRNTTNQHKAIVILCTMEAVGLMGLLLVPTKLIFVWIFFIGFPLGAYFTLALLFFILRAKDTDTTTSISGVAQSFGYLLAAPAPILFGALFDITGSWILPIISLLFIVAAKFYTGWGAGNNEKL